MMFIKEPAEKPIVYTEIAIGEMYNNIAPSEGQTKIPIIKFNPVVQVTNEDNSKSVVSDRNGILDLSGFNDLELLVFSHVSYVELELIKKQIRKDYTTIFLQFRSQLLKEVFLSAGKGDVDRSRIAEEIAVFSNKEIQNSVPQTSADMLAKIPGVKVQKSQFGGGSPVLRGMEANMDA